MAAIRDLFARCNRSSMSELQDLENKLGALRRFVGTNIIAATKIVKKHDKHVHPNLARRGALGKLIRGSRGICTVPTLHADVDAAVVKVQGGGSPIKVSTPTPKRRAFADEDESEEGLRTLPDWLLRGADEEQPDANGESEEDHNDFFETFYTTYLSDWGLRLVGGPAEGVGLLRTGSDGDEDTDAWNVKFTSDATSWGDLTALEKVRALVVNTMKISVILLALYAFVCSLSFLADGVRLVAGRQAGDIFRNSEVFDNPVAGMLVGVLVTVLVQSSSTSTSIVITMVAADLFSVKQAIYIIMGANIGTSVTSTIVALGQSGDRNEFRRAFAAATVHDMFNFLTVVVLLPVEAATGYLFRLSEAVIALSPELSKGSKPPDILKAITKPFTKLITGVDKKVITKIAAADTPEKLAELDGVRMFKKFLGWGPDDMTDSAAGAVILIVALIILCISLAVIVGTLKSLLKGRIAMWLHSSVNGNIPDIRCGPVRIPMAWLTGYVAMLTGLAVTICVQSSSITTSALTPLVGVGVIQVERMYPTVLGANIGTCITGVLAALAADASKLYLTLQVAYAHLLFNISGILIWYTVWPLRAIPINAAKFLGATTAVYRWFAIAYLIMCFFLIPGIIFGISLGSMVATIVVIAVALSIAAFVVVVNVMQNRCPHCLPKTLRTWTWLPLCMRSLEPMDRVICLPLTSCLDKINVCKICCRKKKKRSTGKKPIGTTISADDLEIAMKRVDAASPA